MCALGGHQLTFRRYWGSEQHTQLPVPSSSCPSPPLTSEPRMMCPSKAQKSLNASHPGIILAPFPVQFELFATPRRAQEGSHGSSQHCGYPWVSMRSSTGISPGSVCLHFCQSWADSRAGELCSASSFQSERRRLSQLMVSLQWLQEGVSVSHGMAVGWILSTLCWIKFGSGQRFFFILYDTSPPTFYFFIQLQKF